MKTKLEYIWLDGYAPTQNMRSKTKVVNDFSGNLKNFLNSSKAYFEQKTNGMFNNLKQ